MNSTIPAHMVSEQRKKIHPHKFTLWVGIGSIVMMFAGLTSAYVVKRDMAGWSPVAIPVAFWYSTAVILASSVTVQLARRAFADRQIPLYRRLITATALLGVVFMMLQWLGFRTIWRSGVHFRGSGGGQFLYVIAGLHALHVLGGVVAILVLYFRGRNSRIRSYNPVPVELVSIYWHFVDLLWLYLFIFLLAIR